MTAKIGSTPAPVVKPGGGVGVIRPMYGIFIRDNVAKFRNEITATLNDTKTAIAHGSPKGKEVFGDGVLQGTELTKAKAAAKDLDKAIKALKPVFGDTGIPRPIMNPVRPGTFPGAGGGTIRPMYGMALRDDLAGFKTSISGNIKEIKAAITSGQLKGADKTEAQKALKYLDAALKDLNGAHASVK
jgi:hypothetical protein